MPVPRPARARTVPARVQREATAIFTRTASADNAGSLVQKCVGDKTLPLDSAGLVRETTEVVGKFGAGGFTFDSFGFAVYVLVAPRPRNRTYVLGAITAFW